MTFINIRNYFQSYLKCNKVIPATIFHNFSTTTKKKKRIWYS